MPRLVTNDDYIKKLDLIHSQIIPVEQYKNRKEKILHKCKICSYEWLVAPNQIIAGGGCPICSHRAIGTAPDYINSIFASEYYNFASKYLTEEQMKENMPHSQRYINIVCPDCGAKKRIKIADFINRGFNCICSDGQSFPNKFVYNILSQLKLKIYPEYCPAWSNQLRYDDYLPDFNIIIENHGLQHYEAVRLHPNSKTFEEEKANDLIKHNLAMQNNITEYVILDCRESSLNWIKKSIMQSELPKLLNFLEEDINWIEALRYASNNMIKLSADMYNDGNTVKQIANKLNKSESTIRYWLRRANTAQWCEYNLHTNKGIA